MCLPGFEGGVGGRQTDPPSAPRGGGYQDVCTALDFKKIDPEKNSGDPRLRDLEQIGIRRVWLDIAATIGVDNFLAVWQHLDADPVTHAGNSLSVRLPLKSFDSWLRYQRNSYIRTLARQGYSAQEIRLKLIADIGEEVSLRHIFRLTEKK